MNSGNSVGMGVALRQLNKTEDFICHSKSPMLAKEILCSFLLLLYTLWIGIPYANLKTARGLCLKGLLRPLFAHAKKKN